MRQGAFGNAKVGFCVAKVGRLRINGTLRSAALTFSVWFQAQLYCTNDCQERTSLVLATYNKYIFFFFVCAQKNIFSIPPRVFFAAESLIRLASESRRRYVMTYICILGICNYSRKLSNFILPNCR